MAIKVDDEHGDRHASAKLMCMAAGLSERSFYQSFANGQDLLRQCSLVVEDDLLTSIREAARREASSIAERARSTLLVYLDRIRQDTAMVRVFLIEMANVSPAAEAFVSKPRPVRFAPDGNSVTATADRATADGRR